MRGGDLLWVLGAPLGAAAAPVAAPAPAAVPAPARATQPVAAPQPTPMQLDAPPRPAAPVVAFASGIAAPPRCSPSTAPSSAAPAARFGSAAGAPAGPASSDTAGSSAAGLPDADGDEKMAEAEQGGVRPSGLGESLPSAGSRLPTHLYRLLAPQVSRRLCSC